MVWTSMRGALVVMLLAGIVLRVPAVAEEHRGHGGAGHEMHEGAMSITGTNYFDRMRVLGGSLGREAVEGVEVGLFFLQAESPERLKPGAEGPTHIFNVTFADDEGLIEEAMGTVVIAGHGEEQRLPLRRHQSHYQVLPRLEQEGEYRIRVEFLVRDLKGKTEAFPFNYRRAKADAKAVAMPKVAPTKGSSGAPASEEMN